jgi:endogenous inhibitor of DNA gyrase (YacG/DUF329 family)
MKSTKPSLVNCPQCGIPTPYSPQNRFRPFCSERCKMIDLGHWAAEDYRIPGSPISTTENQDPQSNE